MQYEVLFVRSDEPATVASEIAARYKQVAQAAGRIVGSHILACPEVSGEIDTDLLEGTNDHLFLVVEVPEDGRLPRPQRIIASKGGRVSRDTKLRTFAGRVPKHDSRSGSPSLES